MSGEGGRVTLCKKGGLLIRLSCQPARRVSASCDMLRMSSECSGKEKATKWLLD